jgi:hypothetical protein
MFELNTLRTTLSIHAFLSSICLQIKKETFQKQLEIIIHSNILNNGIIIHIPCFNDRGLIFSYVLNIGIFLIALYGYEIYNSPKSTLNKLNNFSDYKEMQKQMKIFLLIIVFIFLRDIDNAV